MEVELKLLTCTILP